MRDLPPFCLYSIYSGCCAFLLRTRCEQGQAFLLLLLFLLLLRHEVVPMPSDIQPPLGVLGNRSQYCELNHLYYSILMRSINHPSMERPSSSSFKMPGPRFGSPQVPTQPRDTVRKLTGDEAIMQTNDDAALCKLYEIKLAPQLIIPASHQDVFYLL